LGISATPFHAARHFAQCADSRKTVIVGAGKVVAICGRVKLCGIDWMGMAGDHFSCCGMVAFSLFNGSTAPPFYFSRREKSEQ
jgi:hypothetical protein